jgi:MFS family permease
MVVDYFSLPIKTQRREAMKAAISGWMGTALEFYDFLIFGYLATILAPLFFPSSNPTTGFIELFAVFGVGFVMRPLGALLFGWVGDRYFGRRNTLMVTIFLMGGVSLGMGLLPTYAEVGILSTILLVIFRLIQGLALGGEFGGSISLTAELAPAKNRGLYVGIAQMAQGGFIPSALVAIFTRVMTHAALVSYGWRILFIIGVIIAVVGFVVRIKLSRSPYMKEVREKRRMTRVPIATAWAKYPLKMLLGIFIVAAGTVITYTFSTYGITYLKLYGHLSLASASLILTIATGLFMVLTPLWSYMSDTYGRKPFILTTFIGLLIVVYPVYYLLGKGIFIIALIAYLIIYVIYSFANGPYGALLSEIFPTEVRYTGVSFSYNLAVGIFGGFSPLIVTVLIAVTKNSLAPIIWLVPFLLIGIIFMIFVFKESKGVDLGTIDKNLEKSATGDGE